MPRYTDLMELKNDTARIETIRARVSQFLLQVSKEEFGADYVRFADRRMSQNIPLLQMLGMVKMKAVFPLGYALKFLSRSRNGKQLKTRTIRQDMV